MKRLLLCALLAACGADNVTEITADTTCQDTIDSKWLVTIPTPIPPEVTTDVLTTEWPGMTITTGADTEIDLGLRSDGVLVWRKTKERK